MNTKVYIPNKSIHDFSSAEEFGDLYYLSEGNINRYNTSRLFRKFYPLLKDSQKEDYLLISGLTIANIVAAFILTLKHKRLNLLLFKTYNSRKGYVERILIGEDF